jgi:hypothetical protein
MLLTENPPLVHVAEPLSEGLDPAADSFEPDLVDHECPWARPRPSQRRN